MVLKKRLDYKFKGFLVPVIPKGPRSIRKRAPHKKRNEDICAFELLASLAGKLLQESESSSSSNASEEYHPAFDKYVVQQEKPDESKPLKAECIDQESCQNGFFFSEKIGRTCNLKELSHGDSDKVKLVGESAVINVENEIVKHTALEIVKTELLMKSPAEASSDSKIKPSRPRDAIRSATFSRHKNGTKFGSRDDDENFSRRTKSRTKLNSFRYPSRIAERRIRKLLNSKYWKVAPKLRDSEIATSAYVDGGLRPFYRKRRTSYNCERCPRDTLFKKRRCHDKRSSVVTSDGGMSSESVSNIPEKSINVDKTGLPVTFHGASRASPSVLSHQASFHSRDSHVKFSIKSFKVPELFIEVPEKATVGSLKRTVMEAVTAILGGGLRVGVVLHGKKVRDDNRTLLQTGLSSKDNLDTVGFTLEPSPTQSPSPMWPADSPLIPCDNSKLLISSPETPVLNSEISDSLLSTPSDNQGENGQDLFIPLQTDMLTVNLSPDCKAIVAVPELTIDALAVVPANQNNKRAEPVQRRTRRPFSVSEVESLVEAVEDLGTGRWRDVKFRAFEDADHRTYVDLKDKWKTLVHTARISPQQRRGEPVPQELLDRVLAAHAYWSQHQAKQHGKHQAGNLKVIEGP